MKEKLKNTKKKIITVLVLLVFLVSLFKIGSVLSATDPFKITNLEVISKSDTVTINSINYEKNIVKNDITFHQIGDSITYKVTIKNNNNENIL